jgi:tetratricopeptide (TPR) repeat protein
MAAAADLRETVLRVRGLIRAGRVQEATALLQNLPTPSGDAEEVLSLLGSAQFLGKEYAAARGTFERLTQLYPSFAGGWVNLGAVLNKLGEHRKAVEAFRRAIQKDSKCADAYYNMGIAQKALNLSMMAIGAWREAVRLQPEMFEAHLQLAKLYGEMKNYGMARKCAQDALRIRPDSARAQEVLTGLQKQQMEAKKSESPFGRLVNTAELERQSARTVARELTPAVRQQERELVQSVTKRIRQESRDLVPLLDEGLSTSLQRLQRLIRDPQSGNHGDWPLDGFSAAVRELEGKMGIVSGGVGELRTFLGEIEK